MRNSIKVLLLLILAGFITTTNGQTKYKFGHLNSTELLEKMPGRDSARNILESYAKEVQAQFKIMQSELETKYADYQTNEKNMTELIKKTKMEELTDLQGRIDAFQKSAQEDMQKKENDLLKPILDKAKKAIEDVAAENKFNYVFDTSYGLLLYSDPGEDILPLVKKKLGLK